MDLKEKIRSIPDYPKKGVIFRDITTLLREPEAYKEAVDRLTEAAGELKPEILVGIEARGFIVGAPVAYALGCGFVPVRKPGKLPSGKIAADYELEYGKDTLEMNDDAVSPGQRVLIIDDLLATGGTSKAVVKMVEELGGEVVGLEFLIELTGLKGREALKGYPVKSIIQYD